MRHIEIFIIIAVIIAGCTGTDTHISKVTDKPEEKVIFHDANVGKPYDIVGPVIIDDCFRGIYGSSSVNYEYTASKMYSQARELGADAVINGECGRMADKKVEGCYEYIECTGQAIKYKK